jgi:hypothetical protein
MLDNLLVQVNLYDRVWTKSFLNQCLVFIRNSLGRPEAMNGEHDDAIISVGICHYIRQNAPAEFKNPSIVQPKSVEQRIMERLERKKMNQQGISQRNYY